MNPIITITISTFHIKFIKVRINIKDKTYMIKIFLCGIFCKFYVCDSQSLIFIYMFRLLNL